jgi:hypothetical protein
VRQGSEVEGEDYADHLQPSAIKAVK